MDMKIHIPKGQTITAPEVLGMMAEIYHKVVATEAHKIIAADYEVIVYSTPERDDVYISRLGRRDRDSLVIASCTIEQGETGTDSIGISPYSATIERAEEVITAIYMLISDGGELLRHK